MRYFRIPIEASVGAVWIKAKSPDQALAKADSPDNPAAIRVDWDPEPFDLNPDDLEEVSREDFLAATGEG